MLNEPIDFNSADFQEWIEERLKMIVDFKPRCMFMLGVSSKDDSVALTYYDANTADMRLAGHALLDEATLEMIKENFNIGEMEDNADDTI